MLKKSLSIAGLLMLPLLANAATVTVYGDDVMFTYDDATLFGTATVVGNSLTFNPTNFRAESLNGTPGAVSASATLNIRAEVTTSGYVMTNFALAEQGDYQLSAGDTSVNGSARLQISSGTTTCGIFACEDNSVDNITGLNTVGSTTNWSASTAVNLADTAGWGSDTLAIVQIQNNLTATTLNAGELAWIQKKNSGIGMEVQISEVPVPAGFWLFGSALGALGLIRRSR